MRLMFSLSHANRFFIYPFPTDMRKSFDSLSGIVKNQMGMNVMERDAFIFVHRFCTSRKVLHVECGGLVIYNLRLEKGNIELPEIAEEDKRTAIETRWNQLVMMVGGLRASDYKQQKRWAPPPKSL